MSTVNLAHIIGHVGRKPELKYGANNTTITKFPVATSRKVKGGEETTWHNITCFGRTAEIASEYVTKGGLVSIIGQIRNRQYEGSDGTKRLSTEIICDKLTLLGPRSEKSGPKEERDLRNDPRRTTPPPEHDDYQDDVPF